jgi:4-hydroxybenzoate polyprenyltransferase
MDRHADSLHPAKKRRPIAAGVVPIWLAGIVSISLAAGALLLASNVHKTLVVMVLGYMVLQLAYTFLFKKAIIIDAMLISLGFVLRVYAGSFVIAEPLSAWLLLAVAAGAWFLALGKRRSELTLMGHRVAAEHRPTLSHYPEVLLDSLTTMAATSTLVFYSLYTFLNAKQVLSGMWAQYLPSTLESPKLLMLTLPFVLYGIARYLYLIYEKKEADSPELALLHDWPLLVNVLLLIATLTAILYILPIGASNG